jgi:hypothetical protein
MKKPILIIVLILWASCGWAATICVEDIGEALPYYKTCTDPAVTCGTITTGDTNGDLEAALNASSTDGVLHICAGTYSTTELDSDSILNATHSGQTIRNYGTVILDAFGGSNAAIQVVSKATFSLIGSGGEGAFVLTGGANYGITAATNSVESNFIVEGITVNASGGASAKQGGIVYQGLLGYSVAGSIKGNWVRNIQGMGIDTNGWIDSVVIENNVVSGTGDHPTNQGQHGISVHATPTTIASGGANWTNSSGTIYYTAETDTVYDVVEYSNDEKLTEADGDYASLSDGEWDFYDGNLYVNVGEDPDNVNMAYSTSIVDSVIVRYNDVSYTVDDDGVEGHGIAFDGFNTNCEAYGNNVHDNLGSGIQVNYGDSILLHSNKIVNNADHGIVLIQAANSSEIYNNTIDGNGGPGILNRNNRLNTIVKNNIISNNGTYGVNMEGADDAMTLDNNCWYNNTSGNVYQASQGANKVEGNPQLTSTYRPLIGSPVIDAGVLLTWMVEGTQTRCGTAPEIGRYEYCGTAGLFPMIVPLGGVSTPTLAFYDASGGHYLIIDSSGNFLLIDSGGTNKLKIDSN